MDSHSFVEKGLALALIRDKRLFRQSGDYKGFEDYCQKKWQYGRRYVNQIISAAQLFTHLGASGSLKKPVRERQLRPLADLPSRRLRLLCQQRQVLSDVLRIGLLEAAGLELANEPRARPLIPDLLSSGKDTKRCAPLRFPQVASADRLTDLRLLARIIAFDTRLLAL